MGKGKFMKKRMKGVWLFQTGLFSFAFLIAIFGIGVSSPEIVQAANPFIVNTTMETTDSNLSDGICLDALNHCSLRAAVQQANYNPGVDKIILPPGTYTLALAGRNEDAAASGDLDITDGLTIVGANGDPDADPALTTIDAAGIDKAFSVNPLMNKAFDTTFQSLTIKNGSNNASGSSGYEYGGAMDWDSYGSGTLTIDNCVIEHNESVNGPGGAILASNETPTSTGTLTVSRSKILNNHAGQQGGGISLGPNLGLVITDSAIQGNTAASSGGGLYFLGSNFSIKNATISGNSASEGGGVYGELDGTESMDNVTVSGNADSSGKGGGLSFHEKFGGTPAASLTITNATITNNSIGLYLDSSYGNPIVKLRNSIVAGNLSGDIAVRDLNILDTANSGYNLIGTGGSGGLANGTNGNRVGIDPKIGPLADNGGNVQTHGLQAGSPALDAGNNMYASGLATDARGTAHPRLADSADANTTSTVDIGAFEAYPSIEAIADKTTGTNEPVSFTVQVGDASLGIEGITAASSDPTLVPDANIAISGSGSSRTFTITPAAGQSGVATITATVTASGSAMSTSFQLTVTPKPDLAVKVSHSGNFTVGQSGATYTLDIRNAGLAPTNGTVTVSDALPLGLTASAIGGLGWTCNLVSLTCSRSDTLAAGSSYPSITVTVNVDANASSPVMNNASVSGGGDGNVSNNAAADETVIDSLPDLTVNAAHNGGFTQGQTGATYEITVTNSGGGAANGTVTVTDAVPSGLTATAIEGAGWNCDLSALTCERSDALAAGANYPAITITVDVDPDAAANVANRVEVSGGGEHNTANNAAADATSITQLADLAITASHAGSLTQGQTGVIYSFSVWNAGRGPASGTVQVVLQPSVELTVQSITGSGWTCDLPSLTCMRSDALAAGANYPVITVSASIAGQADSPATFDAAVSGGGNILTANDHASDSAVLNSPPITADDQVAVRIGKTAQGTVQASDPDGDSLHFAISAAPAHGTATLDAANGNWNYAPDSVYTGADAFTVTVVDGHGGQASSTVRLNVIADNAAPIVQLSMNGNAQWTRSASVTAMVYDSGGSGLDLAGLTYDWTQDPTPAVLSGTAFHSGDTLSVNGLNGDWYLHVYAVDGAGNETRFVSNRFRFDNGVPTVRLSLDQDGMAYSQSTWTNRSVTASVYADDSASGIADVQLSLDGGSTWGPYSAPVAIDQDGVHPLIARAVDRAGNVNEVRGSVQISLNGIRLTPFLRLANGDTYHEGEWTRQTVTASVYAEAETGIRSLRYTRNGTEWTNYANREPLPLTSEGIQALTFEAEDEAGSVSRISLTVKIDRTAPTLQLVGDDHVILYVGEGYREPGFTASDLIDGDLTALVSVAGTLDASRAGEYRLNYEVTDSAGNQAVATRTVQVVERETPHSTHRNSTVSKNEMPQSFADILTKRTDQNGAARFSLDVSKVNQWVDHIGNVPDRLVVSSDTGKDVSVAIPADVWSKIRNSRQKSELEIKNANAVYRFPLQWLDPEALRRTYGWAEDQALTLSISIREVKGQERGSLDRQLSGEGLSAASAIFEFQVEAQVGDHPAQAIDHFGSAYIERSVVLGDGFDPSEDRKLTGIYWDRQGKLHFVPTEFKKDGDVWIAVMKRKGNSKYAVVRNKLDFNDIQGHWAKASIESLAAKLILSGRGDGRFAPEQTVTRAEFAAMLVRGLGLSANEGSKLDFTDVHPADWYYDSVSIAVRSGLIQGLGNQTFKPAQRITREEMAVMIWNAAKIAQADLFRNSSVEGLRKYQDNSQVSTWARKSLNVLVQNGLFAGRGEETLAPHAPLTRAEAASELERFLQYVHFIN